MAKHPKTATPIRLALRQEGEWWVAYIARTEDMEGAFEISRMHLNALAAAGDGRERWKGLMIDIVNGMLAGIGATVLEWDEHRAPESERSGRA